ncbi:MAG: hypothetical protein IJQ50_03865, partial [Clostridia bacterium]|nr:hypothetical protein [Clostridia bacterium]
MKKLMSILLTVSLMAVMVIIPTTASAANNPVPYKQIVYSQDFNDASNVLLNNTTAFTTLPGGTWCGYDATAALEARSQETPDDMCLNSPNAGSKLFIWTLPSAISVTDDTTYELSFDYYASGDEIVYLATPARADTYVRMQSGNALSRNQWNTVTMIFNAANHTISVNGVGNSGTWNAAESYTRFMVVHSGGAVKIDNFKMYKYVYTPTVEGVSFIDNLGNEITDFENMSPSVSSIKININNAADVDEILDNFYIFDEDNEEEVVLGDDATYENNVFTVSLPDGLKANCNYSINVDSDLKNSKGETGVGAYIEFSTTASTVSATLTANAPDTYSTDKWKTQWSKTFDTSADFAIDGEYQNRAGFINELNSLEYDSTNQCMKTTTSNIPRFDVNLPVQYSSVAGTAIVLMPDRVRYSFDVK